MLSNSEPNYRAALDAGHALRFRAEEIERAVPAQCR